MEVKKTAYEKGTDDYLCKFFDVHEFIYTLNAVERRIIVKLDTQRAHRGFDSQLLLKALDLFLYNQDFLE